ncbi:MAG TPA: secondary thiamine-phosphate synthase enzyme YjbQ [Bacteroidales bacterium]|jgi:secondary thiamine-phosphate synthase enzyme|nr:secondary thiamine-phosphate synthase enzyme YjbQ [Bacteroidales bacterium]
MWIQKKIQLTARSRGFHLITHSILDHLPEIQTFSVGILHLFIQHSSASLTINENADPDVRTDFETFFNTIIPDTNRYFIHTHEGADDMPAHIKASVLGCSVSIPITQGKLALGTWQGIYLCEHRNYGGSRKIVATIWGE